MSFVRVGVVLVGVVAAAASATAPSTHNVKRSTDVSLDFEATWTAVIDLFADRGWAIDNLDKHSGLITTDWMHLGDDKDVYADCGGAGISSVHGTQIRFNVRVKPAGDSTELTVNTKFRQLRSFDGVASEVECASRGAVEAMVHEQVASRTASRPPDSAQKSNKPPAVTEPAAPAPRGFYCSSSTATPTAGFCAREKSDCQRARDAALGVVADLEECRLVETAFCFVSDGNERCAPTPSACADRASSASSVTATCDERQ